MSRTAEAEGSVWRLGSFRIGAELGRGGMGVVYAGTHVETGAPVVVKTLLREDAARVARFYEEAQAAAALDHPRVVRVLDFGLLPAHVPDDPLLRAGAPFLIMERASGVPLSARLPLRDDAVCSRWRALVEALLDALAHAHARGVLHRDVKPGNVLVDGIAGGDEVGAPWRSITLIDLGIARWRGALAEEPPSGTPAYMAPEQLGVETSLGEGPWTDLYALGCTAWHALTGAPPWWRPDVRALIQHKRAAVPPPLPAAHARHEGLRRWFDQMLAADPRDRFASAADALRVFRLVSWSDEAPGGDLTSLSPPSTRALSLFTLDSLFGVPDLAMPVVGATSREVRGGGADAAEHAPLPDWRGATREVRGELASGLGVVHMRRPPLLEREEIMEALWSSLRAAHQAKTPRVVVLSGAAGVGCSALARWLVERGEELGAARALRGTFDPSAGTRAGLLGAFTGALERAGVVARDARCAAVRDAMCAFDAGDAAQAPDAITEADSFARLVDHLLGTPHPLGMESHAGTTHLANLLTATARGRRDAPSRPLVVWLDDVHLADEPDHALDALEAARGPIVLVLTRRLGADDAHTEARLRALEAQGRCVWHTVTPLSARGAGALLDAMVRLPDAAREALREAAGHTPQTLVEGARALVEDGALEHARGAVRWRGELPPCATPTALAAHRLGRVLGELEDGDAAPLHRALVLAAALGRRVEESLWRAVCAEARVPWSPDALAPLLRAGLLSRADDAWRFTQGALAEHLASLATPDDHALCAAAHARRPAPPSGGHQLARHLLLARQFEALDETLRLHLGHWHPPTALRWYARARQAIEQDEEATPETRLLRLAQLLVHTHDALINHGVEPDLCAQLDAELCALLDDPRLPITGRATIRTQQAWQALYEERHDEGIRYARESLALLGDDPQRWWHRCTTARALANLLIFSGEPRDALPHLDEALAALEHAPPEDPQRVRQRAWTHYEHALALSEFASPEETRAQAHLARGFMEEIQHPAGVASCLIVLADVADNTARLDEMIDALREARRLYLDAGDSAWLPATDDLARALALSGRFDEAAHHLRVYLESADEAPEMFGGGSDDAWLLIHAGLGRWASWDDTMTRLAHQELEDDPRVLRMFRAAHAHTEACGQSARAARLRQLIAREEERQRRP